MTPTEAVRLKTGDKSALTRESARGDGTQQHFKLQHDTLTAAPIVWVDGALQSETSDYTVNSSDGVISFLVAPAIGLEIIIQYYWAVFSDDEVEYFLSESAENVTLASSKLLMALAADAAKVAMRETMSGGGGTGSVTRDTSLTAQELRETANVLYKQYTEEAGSSFPADGLTEIPWTVHMVDRIDDQDLYRDWPE